jgi:hypothetical protein
MNAAIKATIGTILVLTGGGMMICQPLLVLLRPTAINWLSLFWSLAVYAVMIYVGVILVRKSKYGARQ